ncbi:tyrosine-type recombinase/integrase [Methylobacterium sp. P31]
MQLRSVISPNLNAIASSEHARARSDILSAEPLVTGCRYGELIRMRAADFDAAAGILTVGRTKSGKPRHVALNDDGAALFASLVSGKAGTSLIFAREDSTALGPSHQQRPLIEASHRANIEPACTFHILRHTYGSVLAMRGVPMGLIAAQLGHADTRMTERHYAHFAPSYIASTIRGALPSFSFVSLRRMAAKTSAT